jgi:hypothetical protein
MRDKIMQIKLGGTKMLDKWEYNEEGLVNATQIVKDGNEYRRTLNEKPLSLRTFMITKQTKEYIEIIKELKNIDNVYTVVSGCQGATWMHPMLALELTMSISSKVKYDCMKMIQDGFVYLKDTK